MKIAITPRNKIKINDALDAVNGDAIAFTIHHHYHITVLAERAERLLKMRGVLVKHLKGCTFTYTPPGPSAKSYTFGAISTTVRIERGSNDWFLVEAKRTLVY